MAFQQRGGKGADKRYGWPTAQSHTDRAHIERPARRPAEPSANPLVEDEARPIRTPLFELPNEESQSDTSPSSLPATTQTNDAAQRDIQTQDRQNRGQQNRGRPLDNSRGILSDADLAELDKELAAAGLETESDDQVPVDDAPHARDRTNNFDPHVVWQMALSELALQMPPATYDTWVRDTVVIGYEDGEFIIGMPNAYARDWLENRLRHTIKRTLSSIMRRSVQLQFRVRTRPVQDETQTATAPLYQAAVQESVVTNSAHPGREPNSAPPSPSMQDSIAQEPTAKNDGLSSEPTIPPASTQAESSQPGSVTSSLSSAQNDPSPNNTQRGNSAESGAPQTGMPRAAQLNPFHTFETFVVGSHNRLAHAAALAIVDAPGQTFNPLFIYGGVGLGKTHLLNAIGNSVRQKGLHILYCSSEQFTNDLISAIRNQNTEQFRNKYRQVDVLLIDDIQFIAGKESTQEEFFHTFNHLHAAGRQVVLTSDRPPKAIATLEERLRSRFEGGLQTDIAQPDFETRVAILQSKANRIGADVPQEVLMVVAERVDSNIRELEGALNRLVMQARLSNQTLNLMLARTLLDNLAPQRLPCAPDDVIRIVAEHSSLRPEDLTGRKRTKEVAFARQIAMYLLREENDLSLPAIGQHLGGRDHSTIRYGVERITDELDHNESLRMVILSLRDKI